jgi:glycosyltransferase involved in cell wall biosynthesis
LKKIIAENDISVVHAHIYYGSVFSLLAAKLRGVRLRIVHSHATSPEPKPTLVKRFCFLGASIGIELLANRFMACGRNAGKTLYMPWRAFRVLPNGIDLKSFCYNENSRQGVRRELGIDENSTVLMHTGRFAEVKNHTFLIDIFAEYQSIVPDSQLILIGVGPLKAGIEAKVERLHLSDKVKFVGLRSDVNRICSAADIFLFPSLFEGFPVALIEAQANGLTCLVSDTIDTGIRLTERVEFYSLSKGAKAWAHRISELDRERGGVRQGLVGSAYDISANIGEIEKMYEGGE